MSTEDIPAIAGGNSHSVNLRLMEFWCDAPHAWFKATEALFRLRGITDDAVKYSLLLTALPRDAFWAVSHLIGDGDEVEDNAYATLNAALISSHVLSNYQRVEMLSRVEPLGGRRPSELLTTMLELCPKGEETSSFFCYFFLQRLPREIQVLLAEEDPSNMRAIADKAGGSAQPLRTRHCSRRRRCCGHRLRRRGGHCRGCRQVQPARLQKVQQEEAAEQQARCQGRLCGPRRQEDQPLLLPCQVQQQGPQVPAALRLVGKLGGRGVTAAAAHPGTLFFITDTLTGRRFLVDTGSSFSLIPYRSSKRQCGPTLRAADNRRIPCWGFSRAMVKLANGDFTWSLLPAAVKFPILGMDFLWNFRLLVDPVGNRLLTRQDLPPTAALVAAPLAAAATEDPWQALL
jgi:hypothetical protein